MWVLGGLEGCWGGGRFGDSGGGSVGIRIGIVVDGVGSVERGCGGEGSWGMCDT